MSIVRDPINLTLKNAQNIKCTKKLINLFFQNNIEFKEAINMVNNQDISINKQETVINKYNKNAKPINPNTPVMTGDKTIKPKILVCWG